MFHSLHNFNVFLKYYRLSAVLDVSRAIFCKYSVVELLVSFIQGYGRESLSQSTCNETVGPGSKTGVIFSRCGAQLGQSRAH